MLLSKEGAIPQRYIESYAGDNSGEKETQYLDTLTAIAEGRTKLLQHQSEYDQLALDLQSRLDDKEFKAEEIRDSLYQFKRLNIYAYV